MHSPEESPDSHPSVASLEIHALDRGINALKARSRVYSKACREANMEQIYGGDKSETK